MDDKLLMFKQHIDDIRRDADCNASHDIRCPDSMLSVSDFMFANVQNVKSICLNNDLEHIGRCAFSSCDSLEHVSIPASVRKIDDFAFSQCKSLASCEFLGDEVELGDGIFHDCPNLKSVALPRLQRKIPHKMFSKCRRLKHITLPDALETVGSKAFELCRSLDRIHFHSKMRSVGEKAFRNCFMLSCVAFDDLSEIEFGMSPFMGCVSMNEVKVMTDECVKTSSFKQLSASIVDCYRSRHVDSHELDFLSQRNCISSHQFYCSDLSVLSVPGNVTSIGDNAFAHSYLLDRIELNDGLCEIGDCAFRYCFSLSSISFPDSVQMFGTNVFDKCIYLNNVRLPKNIDCIPDFMFYKCYSLDSIDIPANVKRIGKHAFSECRSLKNICIPSTVEAIDDTAFENCDLFSDIVEKNNFISCLSNFDMILAYAVGDISSVNGNETGRETEVVHFQNCRTLTSNVLHVADGTTKLGQGAYSDNELLTDVHLPDSLTSIEDLCFENCVNLSSINIPDGVQHLGVNVFSNCNLVDVKISEQQLNRFRRSFSKYLRSKNLKEI